MDQSNIEMIDIFDYVRIKLEIYLTVKGEKIHDYVPLDNHSPQVLYEEKVYSHEIEFINGKDNEVVKKIQKYIMDFINKMNYGKITISSALSNYYISERIFIDEYSGNIYNKMIKADTSELKCQIALNGILYLINYFHDNFSVPESIPLQQIINDYRKKLIKDNYFVDEIFKIGKVYVGIYDSFRNFKIHVLQWWSDFELDYECLFKKEEIEEYLNDNLYKYDFGESVKDLYFLYYILNFNIEKNKIYIDNEIQAYKYLQNKKFMEIRGIYDAKKMTKCIKPRNKNKKHWTKCTKEDQIKYLHKGMLEAINRIDAMENRPKDFNVEYLYEIIDKLMNDYEERISHGGDGSVKIT